MRGFIPIFGPAREAWEQYQEGNITQAALCAILAGVDGVGVGCLAKAGLKLVWVGGKQVLKEVAVRKVVHQAERQAFKLGANAGSNALTGSKLLPQFTSVESIINFSTFEQLSKSNPALQAFIRGNISVEGLANLGAILGLSSEMGALPFIEGVGPGVGVNNAVQGARQNGLATSAQQRPDAASANNPPTTNGKGNGNDGQQSNPNKKNPAERPKGGKDSTEQKHYTKQSGKNEKHQNLDKRNAAQAKVESLQQELKELRNAKPDDKDKKSKTEWIEKQIKHWRKKADESGEAHGRRTKNKKNKR